MVALVIVHAAVAILNVALNIALVVSLAAVLGLVAFVVDPGLIASLVLLG